jgi:hypothetical protein
MARKKAARTAPKKPARTASRKGSGRKSKRTTAKKTAGRAAGGPVPIVTGRGPTPAEIGAEVVQMIRARAGDEAIWARHWHRKCDSIEGGETRMAWRGLKQVRAKSDWWTQDHALRSGEVEGPYLGATGFAIRFKMQVETLSTGVIDSMEEVGVYTVQNGKVIREEFMGLSETPAAAPGSRPADIAMAGAF